MNIQAPQIIMIVIMALGLGVDLVSHGEPKTGKTNFGITLVARAIMVGLLYWGGFFS